MAEPVLVVHGVANRDKAAFEAQVATLQKTVEARWELVPVFWGNLGGQAQDITDVIPQMSAAVRSLSATELPPTLLEALFAAPTANAADATVAVRSEGERQAQILRGVAQSQPAASAVRAAEADPFAEAIQEQLPQTRFLRHVQSPEVLRAVGRVLGETAPVAPGETTVGASSGGSLVRSAEPSPLDTRGVITDVFNGAKQRAKDVLKALDDLIGKTVGDVLGDFNQRLRGAIAEPFVRFFGDIFAYQRNQDHIQSCLWQAIAEWEAKHGAAGYGTKDTPVHVIAHSLGGVICFDAAVRAEEPLHIKSFLTFGSQAAFFHIIDPRRPLTDYRHDHPVTLPATIGRWISLWDTMDFLAFTAGTVFRQADGKTPLDIPVNDPISLLLADKGWTHSIYWETEELQQALKEALRD